MKQVYFIFQKGDDSVCKIGKSKDSSDRVKQLQTGNPNKLEVYGVLEGYTELETELHKRFAANRIKGTEWFHLSKEEVDLIIEEYEEPDATTEEINEEPENKELIEEVIEETKITTRTYRVNKQEAHTCEKCGVMFSEEKYLKRHMNKRISCDSEHKCNKCNVEFTTAQNLRNHLNRKKPCVPDEVSATITEQVETKCKFCGNEYSSIYSLKRHIITCPIKNNQDVMFKMMETLINEIKEIKKENRLLKQQHSQQTINNNSNSNVN